ncbi:uncharacterized protein EI90DRAFT_3071960 [Cantharellus anzutake]|uniref:uncharacterized protein n=1 Tax=Cantharellus anzutake TaxID=1750568 RepID=UPI001908DC0D|nr:uncharacterized protein EI90DRAFT_3071960 [Cantharellus anzutake]KAF8325856.1 hypothetical protein EI90DRAFT_3071960 [Cantharellus anzutake]
MSPFTTSLEGGVYRICSALGPNLWLTMDPPNPATGKSVVSVRPDNPSARNQQWKFSLYRESNSYSFFSLGQSLYLAVDANSWIPQGRPKPFAFRLRPGGDQEHFHILNFPTNYFVACDGSKATYSYNGSEVGTKWKFKRVLRSARIPKALPLAEVPPVSEGTYRIVNAHSRTYLTMLDTPQSGQKYPSVVGCTYGSDLATQRWIVTLHDLTQTYFLKNVGTERWLSIQEGGAVGSLVAGVDGEIGAVHWDLRQGESEGEFYIQHQGGYSSTVVRLEGGSGSDNAMVCSFPSLPIQSRLSAYGFFHNRSCFWVGWRPKIRFHMIRWVRLTLDWLGSILMVYRQWSFEPAEEDVDPTALQDLPYGGSLKTGRYKIRNVETRALLTQDETFPPSPSKPHCSSPLLNCSKDLSGERAKSQQVSLEWIWMTVFFGAHVLYIVRLRFRSGGIDLW